MILKFLFDEIVLRRIMFNQNEFSQSSNSWMDQGILKGRKYHCTVDLLFDWFGLLCLANKNKNCQLSYI